VQIHHFVKAIQEQPTIIENDDGLKTQEILEAAYASIQKKECFECIEFMCTNANRIINLSI